MKTIKYINKNDCSVFCGKIEIARAYIGMKNRSIRILQGMNRIKTMKQIKKDCPEFLTNNDIPENYYPLLFSK